ncbi:DmsC/YnfH family molybdoenzyme membrane anchor subunit [Acidipila rosea]|uniref:Nitrate reductase (Quinol-dependent) transmembrane subunit n=1 Tax=Acidipila rosea TaxID=768535 RepID=A0A4R1L5W0_9BACT|nr:DmsC/YnfH family molybdoenzyme membrane anchor subunit [Acidipila rosea]TCK73494.1 nitrate reductase (quinol-dependent) transmembrane subunit [Acidipila rosea]
MALPLYERAINGDDDGLVRLTPAGAGAATLIPDRAPAAGEQYRFHFDMTKCIGCRSCEVACNEQNGNPAEIHWRRIGEIEGGTYPDTLRHYLSMGCNHCLDADCVKGCPVDAYTKDPVTGIVLHSAEACIGCQYCVWNCPYSVPQFNAERGVVGKCDMCHGRLTDGLEPACVNACPEAAIAIEIVDRTAWRIDYSSADSPGMPAAGHTISTTRITLPEDAVQTLQRVDAGRIRPEHAHLSLVVMTALMQAVAGTLVCALLRQGAGRGLLTALLGVTGVALNISVLHLGRPAYAWRALKMWRRSWLSREVLLFGLFFAALSAATAMAWLGAGAQWLSWMAAALGVAGVMASACIYLVAARPAWNMVHTPLDFLLSAALLGSMVTPLWTRTDGAGAAAGAAAGLWLANQAVRLVRLSRSERFEERASAGLLNTSGLREALIASLALVAMAGALSLRGDWMAAAVVALGGVLLSRYLFFVSVVPLNMALTFVRGGGR